MLLIKRIDDLRRAIAHSEAGGIALHVWEPPEAYMFLAPPGFRNAPLWGHLFCQDLDILRSVVRRLGVKRVLIHRRRVRGPHVDLYGKPLERAMVMAEAAE